MRAMGSTRMGHQILRQATLDECALNPGFAAGRRWACYLVTVWAALMILGLAATTPAGDLLGYAVEFRRFDYLYVLALMLLAIAFACGSNRYPAWGPMFAGSGCVVHLLREQISSLNLLLIIIPLFAVGVLMVCLPSIRHYKKRVAEIQSQHFPEYARTWNYGNHNQTESDE